MGSGSEDSEVNGGRRKDILGKCPQQSILNVLRVACSDALKQKDFAARVQAIKQKFYNRDFDSIFLDPTNLPIYTAQYVPRRALCYYELFGHPELQKILQNQPKILCLGAGSGSEMLGITAACCRCKPSPITIHSQDYADWSSTLNALESAIRLKWKPEQVKYEFSKSNLLEITSQLEQQIAQSCLVTAMFVFNELFADKAKAINFVKSMVKCMKQGSLFLLVDSAGSFSSVKVGENSYMAYMFFDSLKHIFEPIVAEDSRWFRHTPGLCYPLPIENMRYFVRLYRKL